MTDVNGFARTERTWLAYGTLATYAYCLYGLGPVLAFLHTEMHLSYLVTSLHSTLWAAGAVITGVVYPWLSRRIGRRRLFWGAAASVAASALLFAAGYRLGATLFAAAVLGISGSIMLTGTTAILADEHEHHRDRALAEANVGASAAAVLAPLVIAGLATTTLGWRAGMVAPAGVFLVLWLLFRHVRLVPEQLPATPVSIERLPGRYWVSIALVGIVTGIEFCLVFDAALLLHVHTGLSVQRAAAVLSIFYVGELAGRIGGSQLARTAGYGRRIIGTALAVTALGFAVFWLGRQPGLAVAGLGVAGVGVANLYPFSLAQAVATAPNLTDRASGRAQLAVGAATLTMPLVLGILADREGVARAYLIEPVLIAAAVILFFVTRPGRYPLGTRPTLTRGGSPPSPSGLR